MIFVTCSKCNANFKFTKELSRLVLKENKVLHTYQRCPNCNEDVRIPLITTMSHIAKMRARARRKHG